MRIRALFLDSTPPFMSVHGPPRFHFEPPKLLSFDFIAVPDPAFFSNAYPDPAFLSNMNSASKKHCGSVLIRICNLAYKPASIPVINLYRTAMELLFLMIRWRCDHIPVHGAWGEELQRAYRSLQPGHQQPSPRQHLGKTLSYQLVFRN
jgi:hypothetical protein